MAHASGGKVRCAQEFPFCSNLELTYRSRLIVNCYGLKDRYGRLSGKISDHQSELDYEGWPLEGAGASPLLVAADFYGSIFLTIQ